MKKISLLFLYIALFPACAFSQYLNTGGNIDLYRINFGFSLGMDRANFGVYKNSNYDVPESNPFYPGDTLYAVKPYATAGFSLGLLMNVKLAPLWDLRFTPRFSFIDRKLKYEFNKNSPDTKITEKEVQSTFLEVPLSIKFKSVRQKDVRLYVIGGVKYVTDVRSKKKRDRDINLGPSDERKEIKINDSFMAWEAGIGADFYFTWFKFSPELKISRSFVGILNKDDEHRYNYPLEGLFAEALHLTFYFE